MFSSFLPFLFFSFPFFSGAGGGGWDARGSDMAYVWTSINFDYKDWFTGGKAYWLYYFFTPICFIFQLGLMIQSRGMFQRTLRLLDPSPFMLIVDELDRRERTNPRLEEERSLREVRQMDLSYQGMAITLPSRGLRKLSNSMSLSKLDLSHSQLYELPAAIGFLPSLTHLFLNDNYLSSLQPKIIRRLVNLQELDLRNNKLNDFPLNIIDLSCLQRLSVQGNPLRNDDARKLMMVAHEKRWIDIAGECKIL